MIIPEISFGWHGENRGVMTAAGIDIIDYGLLCAVYSFELYNLDTLDNDSRVFVLRLNILIGEILWNNYN
jgi:hypothetical protein